MGNHLASHTTRRAKHQENARQLVAEYMKTYDKSKTGTLSKEEVRALATDLCNRGAPLVGPGGLILTDADVEFIMRAGGENTSEELKAEDLPAALAVMIAVREDAANFHSLFLKHDRDASGLLPPDQLATLLSEVNDGIAPTPSELQYILNQCEPRGKDAPIPESQLKCAVACWYCLLEPAHDKIKKMFKAWDTHNTGFISKDELSAVMKQIGGGKVTDAEIDVLFKHIDTHNTGSIEYDEFVEWVSGGGVPLGAGVQEPGPANGEKKKITWSTGWMK